MLQLLLAMSLILVPPSPKTCRDYGVPVPDGTKVSGHIIEYNIAHSSKVARHCWGNTKGCAVPIAENWWVIWTIDDTSVRTHEECHALYQIRNHTRDSASSR